MVWPRQRVAAKDYRGAVAAFDRALALDPEQEYLQGFRILAKLQVCDWTDLEKDAARLLADVRKGKAASTPFPLLTIASTPSDQLACAKADIEKLPALSPLWQGDIYKHERIRIAYVSADLHDHPVGQLMAGLIEQHDRSRFEVTAISLGPDDGSSIRARLKKAPDHFIDMAGRDDKEIAAFIRSPEIDIAA